MFRSESPVNATKIIFQIIFGAIRFYFSYSAISPHVAAQVLEGLPDDETPEKPPGRRQVMLTGAYGKARV